MQVRLFGAVDLVTRGPVTHAHPDSPRVVGARRKSVLAALALNAGQLVTTDHLVAAVWGHHPPPSAANTLQAHVSHLRRLLPPEGLRTHGTTGYALTLTDPATDLQVFSRLVAAARERTDPADAARDLDAALALVGGDPLADLRDLDYFAGHAQRLDDTVLATRIALIRALTASGAADRAVGLAAALTPLHPYAEDLHHAHLTARYVAGDQVGALAAYRQVRDLLADELGVDPGPALRDLEQAILRQDPDLTPTARPTAPRRPPSRIPLHGSLIGRVDDAARLHDLLAAGTALVVVTGPGGVGKSALAAAVCAGLPTEIAADVRWIDLADVAAAEVGPRIVESFGAVWRPAIPLLDQVREARRGETTLVVLDSCERVVDDVARCAADLAGDDGIRLLATTQEALRLPHERLLPLHPLPTDPAVDLLLDRAHDAAPGLDLDATARAHAADIAGRLDGMPLALTLAAARLRTMTLAELARGLDDPFAVLQGGHRSAAARHRSLRATVEWSHSLLTPDEQAFFARYAVFRGGAPLAAARAVCGPADPGIFHQVVSGLVDKSLLVHRHTAGGSRLVMHQSIAAYAESRLRASGEAADLHGPHAAAMVALARERATGFRTDDDRAACAALSDDDANFVAAMEAGGSAAVELGAVLWWYWYRTGRVTRGRDLLARALTSQSDAGDVDARTARAGLGYLCWVGDDYAEALAHADAVLAAPAGTPQTAGLAHGVRARALGELGDFAGAAVAATASIQAFAQAGDPWAVAWSRRCRASALVGVGRLEEAMTDAEDALDEFEGLGHSWGVAGTMDLLGNILERLGRIHDAQRLSDRAVAAYRLEGDEAGLRIALQHNADVARAAGDVAAAEAAAREALELSRRHGYRVGVLQALLVLADVTPDDEGAFAREAARLARRLGEAAEVSQAAEEAARSRRVSGSPTVPSPDAG
ncbi:MAG: BTAD domain-containing putative transcriptional regulator [Dermatophilaceae bacterium]